MNDSAKNYIENKTPVCLRHTGVFILFGGANWDRTADLNTASVALSQLSYSPKNGIRLCVSGAHSMQRLGECQAKFTPSCAPILYVNQPVTQNFINLDGPYIRV